MKVVCAWCGKTMGYKKAKKKFDKLVSHGMCKECYDKNIKGISK